MNIINVNFKNRYSSLVAEKRYQYDYGQVLLMDGLDLPPAYEVHFSNKDDLGESITQIGTSDGVTVPDELFLTGKDIYAFTYLHEGESDGRTVYKVRIPVIKRPKPTDEEITPVEQSALDQALAAFQQAANPASEAARRAEAAMRTYPKIIDNKWYVWDVDADAYVDTGINATGVAGVGIANLVSNDDGTIIIVLTDGTRYTTEPLKGEKGDPGKNGYSPTISVTAVGTRHTITITDPTGTKTATINDGEKGDSGDDGIGIQSIVMNNDYTLTITLTDGSSVTTQSIRGEKGDKGDRGEVDTELVEEILSNILVTS